MYYHSCPYFLYIYLKHFLLTHSLTMRLDHSQWFVFTTPHDAPKPTIKSGEGFELRNMTYVISLFLRRMQVLELQYSLPHETTKDVRFPIHNSRSRGTRSFLGKRIYTKHSSLRIPQYLRPRSHSNFSVNFPFLSSPFTPHKSYATASPSPLLLYNLNCRKMIASSAIVPKLPINQGRLTHK
jgi:hypothetical protein